MNRYSLKRGGERPQAWIGAVIGLASTAASLYSNWKNRQAQVQMNNDNIAAQNAEIERQNQLALANNQANSLNNYYAAEEIRRRNLGQDLIYACGGRKSLRAATGAKVKITDGGIAIPIGNGNFLLRGSSHNQVNESGHTGIGMKVGKRTIEAEGGEVIRPTRKSLLIYSRRLPLANGLTPAQSVLAGYNPQDVFAAQQQENGNNSTPVKGNRHKAALGDITPYDWINLGSDIGTALGIGLGNYIGYKRLNTKLARPTYYEETPVILDTRYHNSAQLANLDRMRLAGNRSIGQNTASSQVAQARMRLNNLDYLGRQNELLDYAANQEAALRNTQAQIEQGVRQRNIAAKNAWSAQVADITNRERELENNRTLMLTQNHANTLAGINRGLSNFTSSILQREQDNRALQAMIAASNPGSFKTAIMNGFNPGVTALINEYNNAVAEDDPDINYLNKIRGMLPSRYRRSLNSPNS
jgi:hypothetical protein